jgi:HlyD family secretion protein
VQQGQTVAASLSAPQLFLIANDLTHMQILGQVGENDIAQIKEGQDVDFTVQALPNRTFKGRVQQVRLQSTTTDNVVNYTVVVAVENPKGELLPGMTARVDFMTKSASNILEVPNAALRFRPTDEQLAQLKADAQAKKSDSTSTSTTLHTGSGRKGNGQRPNIATLYYLDAKGKLAAARVRTGITDGTNTEIEGRSITAGMQAISGMASATPSTSSAQQTSASPFGGSSSQQQRGPRGGF